MSFLKSAVILKSDYVLSKLKEFNRALINNKAILQICQIRGFKKGKSEPSKNDEDYDSDDDQKDLSGKGIDIKSNIVGSMRADLILKIGLGLARKRVEEAFYESRIRVNNKKIFKKSVHVDVGDELDLIKGVSESNPAFLTVGRIEILSAKPRSESEGIEVKMRRSKSLTIENYPDGDPWKQADTPGDN